MLSLYTKLVAVLSLLAASLHPHPSAGITTISPSFSTTTVQCQSAYTAYLYETPDGHLDDGYYVIGEAPATATAPIFVPAPTTTAAWIICRDQNGYDHEMRTTINEFTALKTKPFPTLQVRSTTTLGVVP